MSDATSEPVPAPAAPAPVIGEVSKDDKTWGMLAHLSAFCGYIIPLGGIIAPIVIWKTKGAESEFVADQAKEILNFQITMLIAVIVCIILMFVVIGIFLLAIVGIGALILIIMAALKANEGVKYRYPFAIRLIK